MKQLISYTLFIATLWACEKKVDTPPEENKNKMNPVVLVAEEPIEFVSTTPFVLADLNGKHLIEVAKDKQVKVYGRQVAVLDSEGLILATDSSFIAQLNRGNILIDKSLMPVVIAKEDGSVSYGSGVALHWNKSGELIYGTQTVFGKIEPVEKKSFKTAALLYYLFLFRK